MRINSKSFTTVARTALGLAAVAAYVPAGATGVNGFAPTNTNVVSPTLGTVIEGWKQTGTCGASAVQISPSWVLSTHHSHCSVGATFLRQDGQSAVVDLNPPTQPGQLPLANADLHLARLSTPLPYAGNFAPLAYRFPLDAPLNGSNTPRLTDILLTGYGKVVETGLRAFQVGWTPMGDVDRFAPANPKLRGFAQVTDGDSGGGFFAVNPMVPQGTLVGVNRAGFPVGVRQQIDAVLTNPLLNPGGETISWLDGETIKGEEIPEDLNLIPPLFLDNGGQIDALGVPAEGLVTSQTPGALTLRIPQPLARFNAGAPVEVDGYRIRLVREDHLSLGGINSFDYSNTWMPVGRSQTINSGIGPGTWYLTATALVAHTTHTTNPVTGEEETVLTEHESLAAKRVKFVIPPANLRPQVLESLSVASYTHMEDFGDGKAHWCAEINAVVGKGPAPEGILWKVAGRYYRAPLAESGAVCDTWDESRTVFEVQAQPYVGAAIGPAKVIYVGAPSTNP